MMMPLPEAIIALWTPFAALFTQPVWCHVQVLWMGAVLCRGPRTVAAVLRVMGLGGERRFEPYHRVLSRARWSGLQGAKILLGLLIAILPKDWPLVIGADETIERRKGRQIAAKGRYRDAVRSTKGVVVKCYGLKWISLMVLIPLPWSIRVWALPFLTLLAPSERANTVAGRHHKTTVDWTVQAVKVISRWLGSRRWTLVGDGAYACVRLARACAVGSVTLISRLRLDAQLYEFPRRTAPRRRGPKPLKGKRRMALGNRLAEAYRRGKDLEVPWYGGTTRQVRILSECCLWYTTAEPPVAIRWVLVVDSTDHYPPMAVFSTDLDLPIELIIARFSLRWNVEVTFEESRRQLGVETQRQWSDLAIARTTPMLFALFSLVCLMAHRLMALGHLLPIRGTAWYRKSEATFSDVLAMVRRVLWAEKYFPQSTNQQEPSAFHPDEWEILLDQLASIA
ncbi:MAG TPA: transposase [Candidatus Competibacteraceae bacterium]|nr:transposase [Candidatus Competibacteraceae bacterium]